MIVIPMGRERILFDLMQPHREKRVDPYIASHIVHECAVAVSDTPEPHPRLISPRSFAISDTGQLVLLKWNFGPPEPRAVDFGYLSPEATSGETVDDATTNVFSLGVMLWELLSGRSLFKGNTDFETIRRVQATVIPPFSEDSDLDLERLVVRALARRREDRYNDVADLASALAGYLTSRNAVVTAESVRSLLREP